MSRTTDSLSHPAEHSAPGSPEPKIDSSRGGRVLELCLWAAALEGLAVSLALLLGAPVGPTPVRLLLAGATAALTVSFLWLSIKSRSHPPWWNRVQASTQRIAAKESILGLAIAVFDLCVLVTIMAFFGVSLRMNPDAGQLIQVFFLRGLLPLVWLSLIAFQAVVVLWGYSGRSAAWGVRAFLAGGLALGLLLLYWYGAEGQLLFYNVDMGLTDQTAYMDYARLLKGSGYAYPGDFNRMPLYPFLLSVVLRPGMTDNEFFVAAKYANLFLSILLLAGLAALFFRRHSPLHALNLILIVGFTVFIYKAGWVQAELLFYFLNAILFVLMWRLVQKPSYRSAVAAGLVMGLAHLTKASIWPALALFVLAGCLRGGLLWLRRSRFAEGAVLTESPIRALLVVPLTVVVFLAVIFPYLRVSHRLTGHYIYNVNSTFYVWYDSWEAAVAGTKAHGDRLGWPDMPPGEIPSFAKYVREHTLEQMLQRVFVGGQEVMEHVLRSTGYIDYIVVYGGLLLLAVGLNRRRAWEGVSRNPFLSLFFVGYFVAYILLYFWYAPIAAGDRLILAQFIPMLLVLASGVQALIHGEVIPIRGRSIRWSTVLNLLVLGVISVGVFRALTQGVYVLRGGG
ncbi:MAG TPA: hypothetical protein VJK02_24950 [Anaerolineales bacterium]|nr:hypothetical protein [Anaerolineales bacterium]